MRVRPCIATLTSILSVALWAAPAFAQQPTGGGTAAGASSSEPAQPPADPSTPPSGSTTDTGGQVYGEPNPAATPLVEGFEAQLLPSGFAAAPTMAPVEVQRAIWAANEIVGKPYRYGGGHRSFRSVGYDCSGTVSYALHGGDLLEDPLDSSAFMKWGAAGPGDWITVYTNPGHAFVVIAGLRLDTSAAGDPSGAKGPRWRPVERATKGFKRRHPVGL